MLGYCDLCKHQPTNVLDLKIHEVGSWHRWKLAEQAEAEGNIMRAAEIKEALAKRWRDELI